MSQNTLILSEEHKLRNLLNTQKSLEASGVIALKGYYYVVFDNFPQIAKIHRNLNEGKNSNSWLNKKVKGPGFEDIAYAEETEKFYAVVEALKRRGSKKFQPKIYEFDKDFNDFRKNWVKVQFDNGNKGFEGLEHIKRGGKDYLLALCEGNKCRGGDKGKKGGGGRIRVLKKSGNHWVKVNTIKLPKSLKFKDYASLTLQGNRMAIVSQQNSELWIGQLKANTWAISGQGRTYQFPLNTYGQKQYCNVEGACWIGKNKLVVVSDKVKNKQGESCKEKDQAIHIIAIP